MKYFTHSYQNGSQRSFNSNQSMDFVWFYYSLRLVCALLLSYLFSSDSIPETIQFGDFPLEKCFPHHQKDNYPKWRILVTSACPNLLSQHLLLQEKFESCSLSECSQPSTVSKKKTTKLIGHHSSLTRSKKT